MVVAEALSTALFAEGAQFLVAAKARSTALVADGAPSVVRADARTTAWLAIIRAGAVAALLVTNVTRVVYSGASCRDANCRDAARAVIPQRAQ